jgi:fucose permease
MYGLGIGILSISVNNLVCENTNVTQRSRYLSGLHSMYGLSSLVAPYIVSGIYLFQLDWSYIFIFLGVFSLAIYLVSFMVDRVPNRVVNSSISFFAPKKMYFKVGIAGSLYVASEVLLSTRLVLYLVENYGIEKVSASYLLTFFFSCLFLGRLLTSFITFKTNKLKLLKRSLITSIIMLVIGINFYPPLLALAALSMSYFFPFYMGFISESFEDIQKDLIAKLMNFIGAALFISHALFGMISDTYGLEVAIYLPVIFLTISLYILHSVLQKHLRFDMKLK